MRNPKEAHLHLLCAAQDGSPVRAILSRTGRLARLPELSQEKQIVLSEIRADQTAFFEDKAV